MLLSPETQIETSRSLVPLWEQKYNEFLASGDSKLYEYIDGNLTPEQVALINDRVDVHYYFGSHGTRSQDFLAVEKVFDTIDLGSATICFESAGFSLHTEKDVRKSSAEATVSERMRMQREAVLSSRKGVGQNYMAAANAFYYAQKFCVANRVDVRFVDLDRWTYRNLISGMILGGAKYSRILLDGLEDLNLRYWKAGDLSEGVAYWKQMNDSSTMILDDGNDGNVVIPRWGRVHQYREQAAVDRVLYLALERALLLPEIEDGKESIRVFFGANHARGIMQRTRARGVNAKCTMLSDEFIEDSAADMSMDGQTTKAYVKQWINWQLANLYIQGGASDEDTHKQISALLSKVVHLPLSDLGELYESYRSYINWFEGEQSEDVSELDRALVEIMKKRNQPKKIFFDLLTSCFAKSHIKIDDIYREHDTLSTNNLRQLFGQ